MSLFGGNIHQRVALTILCTSIPEAIKIKFVYNNLRILAGDKLGII